MRCGVYVRVSTENQRDNGYSIDSQLRMIKEYCEKNNYDIVDIYNDAGHSGKDLMRPEMQRLLKDIKSHKIETINYKKEAITKQELEKLQENYFVFSNTKISNGEYDNATLTIYNEL